MKKKKETNPIILYGRGDDDDDDDGGGSGVVAVYRREGTVASGFGYRPIARNGTCVAETEWHYFKLDPFAKTPPKVALLLIDRFVYICIYTRVCLCTDIKLSLSSR